MQNDRPAPAMRQVELMGAFVGRRQEAEHFVERLALDPQAEDEGAQLKIRHATVEHGGVELAGVFLRQIAGALGAPADLLDVVSVAHCLLLVFLRRLPPLWAHILPPSA